MLREETFPRDRILFEDQGLVVVDKPHGWLSVPSRMGVLDPRPAVGIHLQSLLGHRLWPVHRLDFEVSGLLLFAKTPQMHRILSELFEKNRIKKTYEALATQRLIESPLPSGIPTSSRDRNSRSTHQYSWAKELWVPEIGVSYHWESLILRGKKRSYESPLGKSASTKACCMNIFQFNTKDALPLEVYYWHLYPHTGRPHQLRFEMFKHGLPIIGDSLYGGTSLLQEKDSIALRCIELEMLEPLPQELKNAKWSIKTHYSNLTSG